MGRPGIVARQACRVKAGQSSMVGCAIACPRDGFRQPRLYFAMPETLTGNRVWKPRREEQSVTEIEIPAEIDVASASFDDLLNMGTGFVIDGVSLVDKKDLLGVPHVITGITWQRIKPEVVAAAKKRGEAPPRGFVSVEATVASRPVLERAVKRGICPGVSEVDGLLIDPNERIVYNDGSTGIRRQLAKLLHKWAIIRVATEITTDRGFDVPWTDWEWHGDQLIEQGSDDNDVPITVPKHVRDHKGGQLAIFVPRGLYVSRYDNDMGEGETYYIK